MTATDLVLDLSDFCAEVLPRAIAWWGVAVIPMIDPARMDRRCVRAAASNRLFVRRKAVRRQRPGESWSSHDHLHLIGEELERMQADGTLDHLSGEVLATALRGCRDPACWACCPPVCRTCGGVPMGSCAVSS